MNKNKTVRAALFAIATLLSAGVCVSAFAASDDLNAKLAVARAQATVELVSKENPAATHDPSFVRAQEKLADAKAEAARNHDREAVWLATESELLANTTAAAAKLAGLEQTQFAIAHDVDVLQLEIRNNRK